MRKKHLMTQAEKARSFKSLHVKGVPLVLYNIWDAGSAKALAEAGAKALATGSWSVAAAQGFEDGEAMPLSFLLQIVERIVATTDLALTVDFEGGYAAAPQDVAENVRAVIRAGAIGINFEDRVVQGEGLYPVEEQVARIRAIRAMAEQEGVPLFINARTDLFLASKPDEHASLVDAAVDRGVAYASAGADGFFIPGLTQIPLIKQVTDAAELPVNVMMRGPLKALEQVAAAGAGRASFGPGPYITAMSDLVERYTALA